MRPEVEREYEEYVRGRLPRLHRAAYLMCGDAHRADDIVQATLTALYLNWRKAAAADNVDGYVHRILVRRYLDDRRLRWSRVHLGDEAARSATVASSDRDVDERDELVTALRSLPKGAAGRAGAALPHRPLGRGDGAGTGLLGRQRQEPERAGAGDPA